MSSFTYHPAESVGEAVTLLGRYGEGTQLLAGGTSLMVLNRLNLLAADHVVGLRGIAEMSGITRTPGGDLRLGALTRLRELETSIDVRQATPALAEAVHTVATLRVRNQATIGGNLAHADPAQDPPPMLMALGAYVEAVGGGGQRRIAVDDLFAGYLETTLAPDEVLTAVVVPRLTSRTRAGYLKFLPGTEDDYATVSVAAAAELADGRCTRLRVALGGVAPTSVRARSVEAALTGRSVDPGDIAQAAALVGDDIDPWSDLRGSADYKRTVAATCVRRLLRRVLLAEEVE
jgi:aerobic carbon-monoxide dehydrogenase medium subunit